MKRAKLVALATMFIAASAIAQESEEPSVTTEEPTAANASTSASEAAPAVNTGDTRARRAPTDRIDLETTIVTGNRELPKVLYIVPWKKAELGELPAQPFNTLLDEVLTPVDRDVFRREVTYYGAISGSDDAAPTGTKPSSQTSRTQ